MWARTGAGAAGSYHMQLKGGSSINMADNVAPSAHGSISPTVERAEIDTTAPFESVKAAVSLFGARVIQGKVDMKIPKPPVEAIPISNERHFHLLQKELVKLRERMKNAETAKAQSQIELVEAKKVVEDLSQKLEKSKELREKANQASEMARLREKELEAVNVETLKDRNTGWQAELDDARNQQMVATAELEAAKLELRKIKQQFATSMEAKASAVKQAEEAMAATEMNSRWVEQLLKEIDTANESLIFVKLACMKSERQRVSIVAKNESQAQQVSAVVDQTRKQIEAAIKGIDARKDLEENLAATTAAVEDLQSQLKAAKESESAVSNDASQAREKLENVKAEIEKTKQQESDAVSLFESTTRDLEVAKEDLKKATEEGLVLKATMDDLTVELGKKKTELADLIEIETQAEARAEDLNSELNTIKSKLAAALVAEAKAIDAASSLSLLLEQLNTETEEAKKEAESMHNESQKAKLEIEQAKSDMKSIDSRLQAALKELEAAKAAEALALRQISALSEKKNAAPAFTSESGAEITISPSEFESLVRRAEEADGVADKRVAAAMAQIDVIKASEREMVMKIDFACREIEALKLAADKELHNAEMAEAAKRAVEGELIKRRACEQQEARKYNVSRSFVGSNMQHSEPLGNGLNMKVPSPDKQGGIQSGSLTLKKKKKKKKKKNQLIPSLSRLFSKDKSE